MSSQIVKLVVEVEPRYKRAISEVLFEVGAGGVEEQGSRRKPRLIVYAPTEAEAVALQERLTEHVQVAFPAASVQARIEVIADSNWDSAWTQYLKPVAITDRFILQPHSDATETPPGMQCILFEPKLAFGDGGHATTRLAARAVESFCVAHPGSRVLDYGTGTGVLAIVAALSGASEAVGVDIDEVSVAAAIENAKLNDVTRCVFQNTNAELDGEFQLVVANIETNVLVSLAPALMRFVSAAHELVVTGFLVDQSDTITQAFAVHGFEPIGSESEDDWQLLRLAKISRTNV